MTQLPKALNLDRVVDAVESVIGCWPKPVPLHEPRFGARERELVLDCVETGWVSSAGQYVTRFEEMVAASVGAKHAVAIVNGTAALHTALVVCGIEAGSEVLLPSITFVATANAVSHAGAIPHFVDVHPETLGLDPEAIEAHLQRIGEFRDGRLHNRLTGRPITAIVPVHVFGHPVDLDRLEPLAERLNLVVIEDATEALGSSLRGRSMGTFGRLAVFSFNGNKIITTGGGGMIVTDDSELAARTRHLTTTGKLSHPWAFNHDVVAYNYRLPNLNAALGCAQMESFPRFLDAKRQLARQYEKAFEGVSGVTFFRERKDVRSNYWLNAIILDPDAADFRDPLLSRFHERGYLARPLWTPMHRLPMYREAPRAELPVSEDLNRRVLNLPSSVPPSIVNT